MVGMEEGMVVGLLGEDGGGYGSGYIGGDGGGEGSDNIKSFLGCEFKISRSSADLDCSLHIHYWTICIEYETHT